MDDIQSTLIYLIPVAAFVVLRILAERRKASAKRERQGIEEAGLTLEERPKAAAAAPPQPGPVQPEPPRAALEGSQASESRPPPIQQPRGQTVGRLPLSIDRLSTMRKAVVLSEILGKPKALREEPGNARW